MAYLPRACGHCRGNSTIQKWVQGGVKEGNPSNLPPTPQFEEGWETGKPDVVVPIPADYIVKPNGPRSIYLPALPANFTEDGWITAVELKPGNRRIVHHAHFDNSPNNKYNPDPTKVIRWGEPSNEEIMDGWLEFIIPKTANTQTTARR